MKLVLPAIPARDDLSKHPRWNVTDEHQEIIDNFYDAANDAPEFMKPRLASIYPPLCSHFSFE